MTSFIVDVSDVLINVAVAITSGSAVLLTEALRGVADLLTSGLLWLGIRRSRRRASRQHKFGYGKELFFWILMSGVSMFILTAGFSVYFGIQRFIVPQPIHQLPLSIGVLVVGLITNSYALSLSLRRLDLIGKRSFSQIIKVVRASTLIETKATAILDLMGSVASVFGLISLIAYALTGDIRLDGLGAIIVGLSSGTFALILITEMRQLIVGRAAPPEVEQRIRTSAEGVSGIHRVLDLRTMQMGSERVMVNMEVYVDQTLQTAAIERLMDDLKAAVKREVPEVQHIQVEIETPNRDYS